MNIAIHSTCPLRQKEATAFARQWNYPLVGELTSQPAFILLFHASHIELTNQTQPHMKPLWVDFTSPSIRHRQAEGFDRRLAQALGQKGQKPLKVIDATAGLGKDAFFIAHLGCQVELLERSPVIATLLADGLLRARQHHPHSPCQRMRLHLAEAVAYLDALGDEERPDVIYLDPMFPQREKSALVKKEMQCLAQLISAPDDPTLLLATARRQARQRVVVKRSLRATALGQLAPHFSLHGRTIRFDIYHPLPT